MVIRLAGIARFLVKGTQRIAGALVHAQSHPQHRYGA